MIDFNELVVFLSQTLCTAILSSASQKYFLKTLDKFCTVYYSKRVKKTTTSNKNMDITQVAKEIRCTLKKEFPATKFSVKSSRFSMGSSVDVNWMDGPTTDQVDKLIGYYGATRSRFISTSRKHSSELVNQAIELWRKQNPEYAHFTVTCKGDTSWGFRAEFNLSEFNSGRFDLQDCEKSLINDTIYGLAFDGTNLIPPQEDADISESETVSALEPDSVEVVAETMLQPQESAVLTSEQLATYWHEKIDVLFPNRLPASLFYMPTYKINNQLYVDDCMIKYISEAQDKNAIVMQYEIESRNLGGEVTYTKYSLMPIIEPIPQPQELVQDLTIELVNLQKLLIAKVEEVNQLKLKIAELQVEKDAQAFRAKMKQFDKQIEANKCETLPQSQPNFDVKALEGKQATLMLVNTIGCPVSRHIKIIEAKIVPAKRYQGDMTSKMCLELKYVQKGNRKIVGTRFTEANLAVALGWQEVKTPNEFTSFDNGLLDAMIRQAKDVVYTQQTGLESTGAMIDRLYMD